MPVIHQLTWVNLLDPPAQIRNPRLLRQVRSHVTKLQHVKKRQQVGPDHDSQQPLQTKIKALPERYGLTKLHDLESGISFDVDGPLIDYAAQDYFTNKQPPPATWFVSPSDLAISSPIDYDYCPSPRLLNDPSDGLDLHLRLLGASAAETYVGSESLTAKHEEKPHTDILQHYYSHIVDCQIDYFEQMSSLPTGLTKSSWMPFVASDYTLFAAVSLVAIGAMRSVKAQTVADMSADLVRMRLFSIGTVQQAMDEQQHHLSDKVIIAVAFFAVFEALYGSTETFHVHMKGLRDMVSLRGGLGTGKLERRVESIILYLDANGARLVGCSPYFEESRPKAVHKQLFLSGLGNVPRRGGGHSSGPDGDFDS